MAAGRGMAPVPPGGALTTPERQVAHCCRCRAEWKLGFAGPSVPCSPGKEALGVQPIQGVCICRP